MPGLLAQVADAPWHLFFPLLSSLLFVSGLMLNKRATSQGVNAWTITFAANMWAVVVFATLLFRGDPMPGWHLFWQPLFIAVMYIAGLSFTFIALNYGDVSIAAPVFSSKVVLVVLLVAFMAGQVPPLLIWCAAGMAMMGIVLVQYNDGEKRHRNVLFTIFFALLAAATFAFCDVSLQMFSDSWGPGAILPIAFAIAAVLSLGFLPLTNFRIANKPRIWLPLTLGSLLIALQAFSLVFALSQYHDAARINIVYTLRALWGVLLAWAFARMLQSGEMHVSRKVMIVRLAGAVILTAAVVAAVFFQVSPETAAK